jgi:hypothetical protein
VIGRGTVLGAAIAVGALMLVPGVATAVGRAARPLARAALKTGATGYDEFVKAAAETYEHMEDIAAEIRADLAEKRRAEEAEGFVQPAEGSASGAAPETD